MLLVIALLALLTYGYYNHVRTGLEYRQKGSPHAQHQNAFGDEELAKVKYKVLRWWYVTLILILPPVARTVN